MKKFLVVLFVLAIAGGYVAADNSTASLEISGTVNPYLSVTFVGHEEGATVEVDLFDESTGEFHNSVELADVKVVANITGYTVDFSGSGDDDAFWLEGDGIEGHISYGLAYDAFDDTRGSQTRTISLDTLEYSEGDIPPEGTYTGDLTVTVSNGS